MVKQPAAASRLAWPAHVTLKFVRGLGRRNCLLIMIAIAAVVLAVNPDGLTTMGFSPLLLSFLPCLAMCALGMCKKRGDGDTACLKNEGAGEGA